MSETQSIHESRPRHKPEFDGGTFTIDYLSTSPNGFEVVTDKSGRRRDPINPDNPSIRTPLPLTSEQREKLRIAMQCQMTFAEGNKAKSSLHKLRSATTDE